MEQNADGVFVMPERDRLEIYISDKGYICIKQSGGHDEPHVVALFPDQVREAVDMLTWLHTDLSHESAEADEHASRQE